ncbi:MAG: hypothetical protein HXY20_07705 [Acidobacteria bacterium]|nr:hypothetical protein [Acidobacteriota bacterium]
MTYVEMGGFYTLASGDAEVKLESRTEIGIEEFYGFKPMVRGNLYLGFLRVLRDDLPVEVCAGPGAATLTSPPRAYRPVSLLPSPFSPPFPLASPDRNAYKG